VKPAPTNEYCKASVYERGWPRSCNAKVWKDGRCKRHHPDTIAVRVAKRDAKWAAEAEARRVAMEARKENERRAAAYPRLVEALKGAAHWVDETEQLGKIDALLRELGEDK